MKEMMKEIVAFTLAFGFVGAAQAAAIANVMARQRRRPTPRCM